MQTYLVNLMEQREKVACLICLCGIVVLSGWCVNCSGDSCGVETNLTSIGSLGSGCHRAVESHQ